MPNHGPIWITGAGGLIGSYFVRTAPAFARATGVVGLTRDRLDLADSGAVRREFRAQAPRLVIHCAALSRSPDCEANPALARKLNVEVTAVLAELCAGIPFFFFSSDLVFDGVKGDYDELAAVNPIGVYAQTKATAERLVLANPRHTVIRTSLNGGVSPTGDRGFNEQLRHAWAGGRVLRLFTDEFRNPIPAPVTARAVWELAEQGRTGLYHVAGAERMSRFRIGELLAARWPQLHPKFEPGSTKDHPGPPRPPDCSLNCGKVQARLSFRLPGLSQWLDQHPEELF